MKPRTEKSMELYRLMLGRGYPEEFCDIITKNLNTDFTAEWMIRYLAHFEHPSLEQVADEMLAIISERNRLISKKEMERTNAALNEYMEG